MKLKSITFYVLLIIFMLFLCEIFLMNTYKLGKPIKYYISPDFGYALRENQTQTRDKKNYISINNLGMRNKLNLLNENNKKIILFFGDSVVYGGSYIDDNEIFSAKVCENLNLKKNNQFFCGNYGVNAYGITNINERILSIQNKIKNDYSITLITSGNIRRGKTSLSGQPFFSKEINPPFRALKELFFFYVDRIRLKFRYSMDNKGHDEEYDKYYYQNINGVINKNIQKFYKTEIERLFENLEKKDKNYLVIYLASKSEYLQNNKFYQKEILIDIAKKKSYNLLVIDEYIDENKIFYDNIHLTKFGHEYISKIILNEISDKLH